METILLNIILITGGILFIAAGLISQYEPYIRWNIKFSNSIRGTKPQITKTTIRAHKISGFIFILLGIGLLVFYLFLPIIISIY